MMLALRLFLVILLATLQLLSPLVHAHTRNSHVVNQGLHIPGLETFHQSQHASIFQNVNKDWDAEGLLVMIGSGIKPPNDLMAETDTTCFSDIESSTLLKLPLATSEINFSPQILLLVFNRHHLPPAPRSPPSSLSML